MRFPAAAALATLLAAGSAFGQELVSFPTTDGGRIYADLYGDGERGVVLAHGGVFDKGSWADQARVLAEAGFRVLAIDFRGRGQSRGPGMSSSVGIRPHYLDVLAAVHYLREAGARSVSVVGGSIGGGAAAQAAIEAPPGEIDRLVLLAHAAVEQPERIPGRKLFISSGGDPRLPGIREQYEQAPEPKELVILPGSAHAQHIFATEDGAQLMSEILRFLSAP